MAERAYSDYFGVGKIESTVRLERYHDDLRAAPGARRRRDPDIAAGAAAVLDHELLAELASELLRHDAGDDVGRAAGRERHHQADGLGGIGLRGSTAAHEGKHETDDESHGGFPPATILE
jgi:hypothetical protein